MTLTRSLSLMRPELRMRHVQDEHVAIFDALLGRDADAAARRMQDHVLNARRRMFEGIGR